MGHYDIFIIIIVSSFIMVSNMSFFFFLSVVRMQFSESAPLTENYPWGRYCIANEFLFLWPKDRAWDTRLLLTLPFN